MYGYIYMTTNLINQKKYIGQRKYRKNENPLEDGYLGSGVLIRRSIEKYGKENFTKTILKECKTREELNQAEIYYIKEYDAVNSDMFYNMANGGEGQLNPSKEIREKLSKAMTGKKHTEETRKRMSESHKGEKNYLYHRHLPENLRKSLGEGQRRRYARGGHPCLGKPKSEETKRKISETLTGRKVPREIAEKAGRTHNIKIYCLTNNKTYASITEASRELHVDGSSISKVCRGKQKHAGGYVFEYRGKPLNKRKKVERVKQYG